MKQSYSLQLVSPASVVLGMVFTGTFMLLSPSARAANFGPLECLEPTFPGDAPSEILCGDKIFSNFTASNPDLVPDTAELSIFIDAANTFFVELDPGQPIFGPFTASLSYMVEIIDPTYFFKEIDLDSTVVVGGVQEIVTKQIFDENGNQIGAPFPLVSIDGEPIPPTPIPGPHLKKITVVDTVDVPNGGTFLGFQNSFTQKRKVPEPTAMLGLFAISGLGLGLKRNKQS